MPAPDRGCGQRWTRLGAVFDSLLKKIGADRQTASEATADADASLAAVREGLR
jgi:hypothetical protein